MLNTDQVLEIKNDKGIVFKICLEIVLYSGDSASPEYRRAVLALLESYAKLFEKSIRWTASKENDRWRKVNGMRSAMHPEDWLADEKRVFRTGWSFIYHGGKQKNDASDICFLAKAGFMNYPRDLGFVAARFPVSLFDNNQYNFIELSKNWAEILRPLHGHAGLSLGLAPDLDTEGKLLMTKLLFEHPGLQFCLLSEGSAPEGKPALRDGIRCADWLLLLSSPFVDALGGRKTD